MEKLIEEQDEKKYSKIQWFFVVIVIPALFAIIVTVFVLTVAGVNVLEKANELKEKIPLIAIKEEVTEKQVLEETKDELTKLEAEVKDREAVIAELETETEGKDQEIEMLKLEKEKLQEQIDDLTLSQQDGEQTFKDIVNTYETMSAKKVAPIITEMNNDEAMKILSSLKSDTLAAILENMEAADAAKYTVLLSNNNEIEANE
jgi:flagellar motility protein MotE (MotC chaperone)